MPNSLIKIGAVSYLNSKPLIEGLSESLHLPTAQADRPCGELSLDLPSRLADQLASGELDAALIPSVESFRHPDFRIVSDACIACHGPVWSVRLLFRTPPAQVKTLALDEGSRTSAALAQILLHRRFGLRPQTRILSMAEDFVHDTQDVDAILVIGDRAMKIEEGFVDQWDLGEEWMRDTGLPFVFAMWVERPNPFHPASSQRSDRLADLLAEARDRGVAALTELAQRYAPSYHLSAEDCERYFRVHLRFRLGPQERAGLDRFRQLYQEIFVEAADPSRVSEHHIPLEHSEVALP